MIYIELCKIAWDKIKLVFSRLSRLIRVMVGYNGRGITHALRTLNQLSWKPYLLQKHKPWLLRCYVPKDEWILTVELYEIGRNHEKIFVSALYSLNYFCSYYSPILSYCIFMFKNVLKTKFYLDSNERYSIE